MRCALCRLLVLWLCAALGVLTQPTSVPPEDDYAGVQRPELGDISANASRRTDLSAAAEKRAVDDDNDRSFVALEARSAGLASNEWSLIPDPDPRRSFAATRAAHVSPRGPPHAG